MKSIHHCTNSASLTPPGAGQNEGMEHQVAG